MYCANAKKPGGHDTNSTRKTADGNYNENQMYTSNQKHGKKTETFLIGDTEKDKYGIVKCSYIT